MRSITMLMGLCAAVGLCVAAVCVAFTQGGRGSDDFYRQTKHGDPVNGVKRLPDVAPGKCVQCHTAHESQETPRPLGLFAANDNGLCYTCHAQSSGRSWPGSGASGYDASAHGTEVQEYGRKPISRCTQCHNPHGSGDSTNGLYPSLTQWIEENGCAGNGGLPGAGCHGTTQGATGANDVWFQLVKKYSHPVARYTKRHRSGESQSVMSGDFSGSSRHSECVDCHNPHSAKRSAGGQKTNRIGPALLGAWGVEFSDLPEWAQPTSFSVRRFTDTSGYYEYQLCLKCHSYFAYGNSPPTSPSGGWPQTDQAMEFSPHNSSLHVVKGSSKAYRDARYVAGFSYDTPLRCTDCHRDEDPQAPRGAHGSQQPFMLGTQPGGAGLVRWDNEATLRHDADVIFCFNCHDRGFSGTGFTTREGENLHTGEHAEKPCQSCHVAVPHGWKRPRFLYFNRGEIDPAPYNNNPLGPGIGGICSMPVVPESGQWSEGSCGGGNPGRHDGPCHG